MALYCFYNREYCMCVIYFLCYKVDEMEMSTEKHGVFIGKFKFQRKKKFYSCKYK